MGYIGSEADKVQKRKEFRWITRNILNAKTPEDERKWRNKLENWEKANPQYAKEIHTHLEKMLDDKINKMTPEERDSFAIELEEELTRREKVMKERATPVGGSNCGSCLEQQIKDEMESEK